MQTCCIISLSPLINEVDGVLLYWASIFPKTGKRTKKQCSAIGTSRMQQGQTKSKQKMCGWETVRGNYRQVFARLVMVDLSPTSVPKDRKKNKCETNTNTRIKAYLAEIMGIYYWAHIWKADLWQEDMIRQSMHTADIVAFPLKEDIQSGSG